MKMLSTGLLMMLVLSGLTGCMTQPQAQQSVREGVFIHIHSGPEQAHRVLMGLRMAEIMSEERDVLVYFDVDGVRHVIKDAEQIEMEPFGSADRMLDVLAHRGVSLYACPGCLMALHYSPADLRQGVKVAEKQAFFNFTQGRILTLDY